MKRNFRVDAHGNVYATNQTCPECGDTENIRPVCIGLGFYLCKSCKCEFRWGGILKHGTEATMKWLRG